MLRESNFPFLPLAFLPVSSSFSCLNIYRLLNKQSTTSWCFDQMFDMGTCVHIMIYLIFFHHCYNYFNVTFISISIIFSYTHKWKWVPGLQQFVFLYVFINILFSLSYQNKLSMPFVLLTDRMFRRDFPCEFYCKFKCYSFVFLFFYSFVFLYFSFDFIFMEICQKFLSQVTMLSKAYCSFSIIRSIETSRENEWVWPLYFQQFSTLRLPL